MGIVMKPSWSFIEYQDGMIICIFDDVNDADNNDDDDESTRCFILILILTLK